VKATFRIPTEAGAKAGECSVVADNGGQPVLDARLVEFHLLLRDSSLTNRRELGRLLRFIPAKTVDYFMIWFQDTLWRSSAKADVVHALCNNNVLYSCAPSTHCEE